MGFSLGNFLATAGASAEGWRDQEDRVMKQRQELLRLQEINRQEAFRQQAQQATQDYLNQLGTFTPWQLTQQSSGDYVIPNVYQVPVVPNVPELPAAPTASAATPSATPTASAATPSAAPTTKTPAPAATQKPVPADTRSISREEAARIQNRMSEIRRQINELEAPWYLPTPEANKSLIAKLNAEYKALEPLYKNYVLPIMRDEYAKANPQYRYTQPLTSAPVPAAPQPATPARQNLNVPATVELNNPGALVYNENIKKLGAVGGHNTGNVTLAIFPDAETGMQAMYKILAGYGQKGFDTVEKIINRWAPPSGKGNNAKSTTNYINFVAKELGVEPTTPLDMQNPQTIQALGAAIAKFESGKKGTATTATTAATATSTATSTATPTATTTAAGLRTSIPKLDTPQIAMPPPGTIDPQQFDMFTQQAMATRNYVHRLASLAAQTGNVNKAIELAGQLQSIDLDIFKMAGDRGVAEFTRFNDPTRLLGVWKTVTGYNIQVQPRSDGRFNLYVNNNIVSGKAGVSKDELIDAFKTDVDRNYVTSKLALQNWIFQKQFEANLEATKSIAINNNTARNELTKTIYAAVVDAQKQIAIDAAKLAHSVKVVNPGDGSGKLIFYTEDGKQIAMVDLKPGTINLNGEKVATASPSVKNFNIFSYAQP